MSIPQDIKLIAKSIWNEEKHLEGTWYICLRGFFFSPLKFGVVLIKLDDAHPDSAPRYGVPFTRKGTVIDSIAVRSQDYRDTISRAQEIWAEKLDDYIAQAVELMEGKGK